MKKSVAAQAVNGKIVFEKPQMNFYLPSFNPNRDIEFSVILLQEDEKAAEVEAGRFALMSSQYITEFKQNQVRAFSGSGSLGDHF